ncbi:hypothetical protein AMECASPLE_022194 [Ameca splendens]|uniref:Uncharacterized protein n=1 Tax=Ameca splendens TaxID=208324 RepID=A0ABV0ZRB6_9TELE
MYACNLRSRCKAAVMKWGPFLGVPARDKQREREIENDFIPQISALYLLSDVHKLHTTESQKSPFPQLHKLLFYLFHKVTKLDVLIEAVILAQIFGTLLKHFSKVW